jgi:hypothetical protein
LLRRLQTAQPRCKRGGCRARNFAGISAFAAGIGALAGPLSAPEAEAEGPTSPTLPIAGATVIVNRGPLLASVTLAAAGVNSAAVSSALPAAEGNAERTTLGRRAKLGAGVPVATVVGCARISSFGSTLVSSTSSVSIAARVRCGLAITARNCRAASIATPAWASKENVTAMPAPLNPTRCRIRFTMRRDCTNALKSGADGCLGVARYLFAVLPRR